MQNHKNWSKFCITCSHNLFTWPGQLMQFMRHLFLPCKLRRVRLLNHVYIHLETRLWNVSKIA